MSKKIWLGSNTCDICNKHCDKFLIDGQTKYGQWAVMCKECFEKVGVGLGIGKGQLYTKNRNNEFEILKMKFTF